MFLDEIERIAKITKGIIKEKNVKIFSHFDADGIASASIISKMLIREGVNFQLRILKQLTQDSIEEIKFNEKDFIIFSDFGSGQLSSLKKLFEKTQILVMDHHEPSSERHFNLFHINPLLHDKENEVPASIITYIFAKFFNKQNVDLIDLAVVGTMADEQDDELELKNLAQKIFLEAESIGKISTTKGLRFYGRSRPIHKSLALSFDPYIPEISGSESNAVQFLSEIGIAINQGGQVRALKDLTLEEQQRLASAIIAERFKSTFEGKIDDIFGTIYTLTGKPEEIQDTKEFGTLINACGRTNNPDVGFRLCLGDYSALHKAMDILEKYKRMLSDALNLLRENKEIFRQTEFANFILGGTRIPETIIGTVTSIAVNSEFLNVNKAFFGFSDTDNNMVKVSGRLPQSLTNLNLGEILKKVVKYTEGEAGGHMRAAGALIPKEKQEEFIKTIDSLLGEAIGSKEN